MVKSKSGESDASDGQEAAAKQEQASKEMAASQENAIKKLGDDVRAEMENRANEIATKQAQAMKEMAEKHESAIKQLGIDLRAEMEKREKEAAAKHEQALKDMAESQETTIAKLGGGLVDIPERLEKLEANIKDYQTEVTVLKAACMQSKEDAAAVINTLQPADKELEVAVRGLEVALFGLSSATSRSLESLEAARRTEAEALDSVKSLELLVARKTPGIDSAPARAAYEEAHQATTRSEAKLLQDEEADLKIHKILPENNLDMKFQELAGELIEAIDTRTKQPLDVELGRLSALVEDLNEKLAGPS